MTLKVDEEKFLDSPKDGMKTLADVRKITGFPHSGTLSSFMENLIIAGFVSKQNLWSFKTNKPHYQGKESRLTREQLNELKIHYNLPKYLHVMDDRPSKKIGTLSG